MAIIKLPNAGDQHQMTVTACEVARGNYGEQVKFEDGTDILYLPKDSADRQLSRIFGEGFAYADAAGNTLVFSRTANTKKPGASPYWNIAPATGAQKAAPVTAPTAAAAAPASASVPATGAGRESAEKRRAAIADAYVALFQKVRAGLGKDVSYEAAQSATATIWITWKDKGIQPDGIDVVMRPVPSHEPAPEIRMPAPSGKRLSPAPVEHDYSTFPPEQSVGDDLPF